MQTYEGEMRQDFIIIVQIRVGTLCVFFLKIVLIKKQNEICLIYCEVSSAEGRANMAAAAIASTRKPSNRSKKIPSKYLNLHLEKLQLEHELTTKFPVKEDITFDKDLELLMMNGLIKLARLRSYHPNID